MKLIKYLKKKQFFGYFIKIENILKRDDSSNEIHEKNILT